MPNRKVSSISIPMQLYKKIKKLINEGRYNSLTDFFLTAARKEIERIEKEKKN